MEEEASQSEAVEQLQTLGLREYEAEALVALIRLGVGTAKEVSETSNVPRTRVYDAVRILEARGLVEIQHSSPQKFRPVPVQEALRTLERGYESRLESLEDGLVELEGTGSSAETPVSEVWTLSESTAIASRLERLVEEATSEVVLVVGTERLFDSSLTESLRTAIDRGVTVAVGTLDGVAGERIGEAVPGAQVFTSGLDWLEATGDIEEATIGQMALVDREAILVSSVGEGGTDEQAVYASGVTNGFVVISRRLLLTGKVGELLSSDD